jgi:DNA repair protein RadC
MTDPRHDEQRYERYQRVVTAALAADAFSLADLKGACAEEQPGFVTRIVTELERDGVLRRSGDLRRPTFHWVPDRAQFSSGSWTSSKVYGNRMTRAPEEERPRERLLRLGAPALKTAELLAILVRTGKRGESALQVGEKIAARYAENLDQLADAGRADLARASSAVGETAYCQILAGIELGRRVAAAGDRRREQVSRINGTDDAVAYCRETFARLADDRAQEEFHIITLNTKNEVLARHQISVGLLDQSMVHPREVFRPAIRDAAKSILLLHNHPSGDPTPSEQDRALTRRLEEAGKTLGIQVLDHIIVARRGAVSLQAWEAAAS